jgi:serine/threonine-protein kinase
MHETLVEGPDPLLGSKVAGRYTVMRKIAKGGMGLVYLAVQEGLDRTVALKIIRREAALDPVMQKRFEREAKAASSLSHPCIVTVHDFGRTDDGSLYLAMEFVDGEMLREVLRRKKRLSFAETLPIVEAIASALARAHAAGVVHRDLKPENIMLPRVSATTTGAVAAKVLDFGLAKPHDPEMVEEHLTRDGGFVGTPGYAAPEQAEGQPEHPRQDLYALGILWFELLAGEHPFAAPTPMKTVVRQLNEEPPSLDGKLPDVPPAASSLIRALMARRPEDRPASAQDVLAGIQAIKGDRPFPVVAVDVRGSSVASAGKSVESIASAPTITAPPALGKKTSSSKSTALLAAGVLAAAGLGAVVVVVASGGLPEKKAAVVDAGPGLEPVESHTGAVVVPRVDAPVDVEVVLEGIPSFAALHGVRDALPTHRLVTYSKERSVLVVVNAAAPPLAEKLQGLALTSDLPLVLEVKELSPGHLALAAVRPEDASALADAGALLDGGNLPDAGPVDVISPGGLAP